MYKRQDNCKKKKKKNTAHTLSRNAQDADAYRRNKLVRVWFVRSYRIIYVPRKIINVPRKLINVPRKKINVPRKLLFQFTWHVNYIFTFDFQLVE